MRKSKLTDGTPIYAIKVDFLVTKKAFANALASHCWTRSEEFDPALSKRNGMELLKRSLWSWGFDGVERDTWSGASEEFVAPFNTAYDAAIEWIEKNYPYLK